MSLRRICASIALLMIALGLLASCSSLVTAYLVNQFLDDKSPKFNWRGTVTDAENRGIPDLTVRIRAEVATDPNPLDFTGLTDGTGHYLISYKWSDKVSYHVTVLNNGTTLAEHNVGSVSKGDQRDDFVVQGNASLSVSGTVTDSTGHPLEGVLVIAASSSTAGGIPAAFTSAPGEIAYDLTSESGVYQIEGASQRFVVAAAYDPDHGFAYATGEDDDSNGDVGLNLSMGATGNHRVQVQVVDGVGSPLANQVLDPARRFRLRLSTPYNLGDEIDQAVADNGLFAGLSGVPSDSHPVTQTLLVESTGASGMADSELLSVAGGTYDVTLLEPDTNNQATAVIQSADPLPLAADSTVIVRVN